jgi:hypothetical protein
MIKCLTNHITNKLVTKKWKFTYTLNNINFKTFLQKLQVFKQYYFNIVLTLFWYQYNINVISNKVLSFQYHFNIELILK